MARKQRLAAIAVLAATATLVAVGLGTVYAALGRVRPFYDQALRIDRQTLESAGHELESRATALYSESRQAGQWQATFTADQVNGWLATKLAEDFSDALPDDVVEPRVAISDGQLTLGFRTRRGGVDTIVSVDAVVMLTEDGEVAIRLLAVQAGAVPLPTMQVADDVAEACRNLKLPVRWTRDNGQPVALVDLGREFGKGEKRLLLDAVDLRDGAIVVAGRTIQAASEVKNQ